MKTNNFKFASIFRLTLKLTFDLPCLWKCWTLFVKSVDETESVFKFSTFSLFYACLTSCCSLFFHMKCAGFKQRNCFLRGLTSYLLLRPASHHTTAENVLSCSKEKRLIWLNHLKGNELTHTPWHHTAQVLLLNWSVKINQSLVGHCGFRHKWFHRRENTLRWLWEPRSSSHTHKGLAAVTFMSYSSSKSLMIHSHD